MSRSRFPERFRAGDLLAGTFVKTPAHEVIEVLAQSGLDFLCLDAEHAAFDRGRLDLCLAMGRALGMPMLVRVASSAPADILQALDSGADGIVVPHVDSVAAAERVARAARFGPGGRGYAGSTRWAGFATRGMAENLAAAAETLVIAQIEDLEAVACCEAIAAFDGIDGVFLGPADLSVAYGTTDPTSPHLLAATERVAKAAAAAGKPCVTFVATPEAAEPLHKLGYTGFFVGSEQGWLRAGANATADTIARLTR
jgi:2-keto-3-deoxy-L-rhamnonate aldolase RhmA